MSVSLQCAKCGSPISDQVAGGECVQCLMQLALETKSVGTGDTAKFQVLQPEKLDELLDDFDVVELLGRGGMGGVYKAWQKKLERFVAIKVPASQIVHHPSLSKRFIREAKALAQLHHPNVVTAFHVGQAEEFPYLVMEYVEGVDLDSYVRQSGPLPVEKAIQWATQIAKGLEFAHKKGIIHRDIKPSNLLVDQEENIRILDLGLARFEQDAAAEDGFKEMSLTDTGSVIGTIGYMAPEQAADTHAADARSDIYSLGCTLHYLLTGKRMFAQSTVIQTIIAHRENPPPELTDQRADLPPRLDDVFQRMVAKSPTARPQTMSEVLQLLQACIGEPISCKSPSPSRADGRRWLPILSAALALVVVVAAATYGLQDKLFARAKKPTGQPATSLKSSNKKTVTPQQTAVIPPAIDPAPAKPRFPAIDPAKYGLEIHQPQWRLIKVFEPQGRIFATRFDSKGDLYFSISRRWGARETVIPPGLYRYDWQGQHQSLLNGDCFEFVFSPDQQRCFAHLGFVGLIAEVDLRTREQIRKLDMSPGDDGATSPHFPPPWYSGSVVGPGEYLFGDFGGHKYGEYTTGGIWKFGSELQSPVRLLEMPDEPARVHALDFGREEVFVALKVGDVGRISVFDGQSLTDVATERPLPVMGGMLFDPQTNRLLVTALQGPSLLEIDVSQPDRPATRASVISGFKNLNFGTLSMSPDGRRLAVVEVQRQTMYLFER